MRRFAWHVTFLKAPHDKAVLGVLSVISFSAQAPSFTRNGFGPFYLFEGSKGRLECVPEAAPRPTEFRWSKDGGPELSGGRYTVEKNGTLVIDEVNFDDRGEYKCSVKNLLDSAEARANATIYGK